MKISKKYQPQRHRGIYIFFYFLLGIGVFDLSGQCNISYSPSSITFTAIGEVQTLTINNESGCLYRVITSPFYQIGISGYTMKITLLINYFDSGAPSEDRIALVEQSSGVLLALIPVYFSVPSSVPPNTSFSNENYILSRTMLNDAGSVYMDKIDYYDGLGRPMQTVCKKASPEQKDIVTLQEYDAAGRLSNSHIPVPVTTSTGKFVAPSTVKTTSGSFYGDAYAYDKVVYEPSPLNRITEEYGPGAAWYAAGKSVKSGRMTNTSSGELSCASYAVASGNSLKRNGFYPAGELFVTRTTGEDGHISYTFTDKLGQVILERVMNGSAMNDTYYVYDDFGNLRYVLPPAASDALTATTTWPDSHTALVNHAYLYKYDHRNRCTRKVLPGCDSISMRYDKADRLVFSQDGNRRARSEWSFFLYDVFGRQTVSGIWKSASLPELDNLVTKTDYSGIGSLAGHTINLMLPQVELMTVNYYDDYAFTSGVSKLNYVPPPTGYGSQFSSAKGLLTGTRAYRLDDPSKYTVSAFYYDHRGRIVQTRSSNSLGGYDDEYFGYTFTGKIKQHQLVHSAPGKTTQMEVYIYTYDHAERLLSATHKLNSASPVTLAEYTHDEVGRIKTKKLATETSNYSYNVRGWLTRISGTNFNQTLAYNAPVNGITPTKELYSGNISAMKWTSGDETTERGYQFTYDNLNRLTDTNYGEGTSIKLNPDQFNEKLSYDKMGNITTLQRGGKVTGGTYNLIDNLTYTYNGNQLTKVSDAVTTPITNEATFHFVDGANTSNEYAYDANGNLIKDLNKNITSITYNALNLPNVITFNDGKSITYGYDASGSKLSVTYNMGNGVISKMEYAGNKIYKNGTLGTILTEEGYITMDGSTQKYHYYLKDHQGNNRVVIDQAGIVEQVNHYYPSGGLYGEGVQTSKQPYKFNGKELDRENGLDVTDLGNRAVYHAINRFTTMDRFAEKFPWQSPYIHAGNNPVNYVDVNGDSISLARMQGLDNALGANYTGKIINDTQSQTGLTLSVGSNGVMTYAKDTNGNPVIATTTDAAGNTIQSGSTTARNIMIAAIDHQDMITVVPAGKSGVPPGTNELRLSINQIDKFINGTFGLDSRTLGWGMTFMHELHHTQIGGGLRDTPGNPGPVVTQMNIIRSELNTLGGNYGQRLDYYATPIGKYNYIPFSTGSQFLISKGIIPAPDKFVKF